MGNFVIQLPYLTSVHIKKTELCSSFIIKQLLHLVALFMATIHMLSVSLIEYFCYTFFKFFFFCGGGDVGKTYFPGQNFLTP